MDLTAGEQRLKDIAKDIVKTGNAPVDLSYFNDNGPDLSGQSFLILGAQYDSGFALNLARAAYMRGADVSVTAMKQGDAVKIKKRNPNLQVMICDVTDDADIANIRTHVKETYVNGIDHVVVTPAFLDPRYFSLEKTWDDLPEEVKQESLEVTAYPIQKIGESLSGLKVDGIYGLSFKGDYVSPDGIHEYIPGYTISGAKKELENIVVGDDGRLTPFSQKMFENGTRANILSLFPFPSVASRTTLSEAFIRELVEKLGIEPMSLPEIIAGSLNAMVGASQLTGYNYHIDKGLRGAMEDPKNAELIAGLAAKHKYGGIDKSMGPINATGDRHY